MNAADDPATARIRNLGAQLDAVPANRSRGCGTTSSHRGSPPCSPRRLPRHDRLRHRDRERPADSQDVSSCRAEFNARMQAASVVLISETVSAALAGTTDDPATIARLSDLSDAVTARTGEYRRRSETGSR